MANTNANTLEDVIKYLKDGGEKTLSIADNAKLFERHDGALSALEEMATFNPVSGEFTGGARMSKLDGVKQLLKQNETFADIADGLGENAGALSKTLEKNKSNLQKNFGKLVTDLDKVTSQIAKAESKMGDDLTRATDKLQKAFDIEMKGHNKALREAGSDADKIKAVEGKIEGLAKRHETVMESLSEIAEDRSTFLKEMKDEIGSVYKGVEKTTGLNAADFRKGTSHAAKVTSAAESAAKGAGAEAKGAMGFIGKNKVMLGAVAAGAVALALLSRGGNQEQARG